MHGSKELMARERRHDLTNARMKPQKNDPRNDEAVATFSDIPTCTRSTENQKMLENLPKDGRTSVRLNASSDLSSTDVVEKRDVLTEHSLQISFADSLRADFSGVHPEIHVKVRGRKYSDS